MFKIVDISRLILAALFFFQFCNSYYSQSNPSNRQVVLQGFWWDYFNSNYSYRYADYLSDLAPRLRSLGIDAIWIPPSIKNKNKKLKGIVHIHELLKYGIK